MPIKVMITVDGNKAASRTEGRANPQEISLALTHIKIREKDLLELFQKSTMTLKDSKEK